MPPKPNTKTLASMVINDIEPDIDSVNAALLEASDYERRQAISRIGAHIPSPIRTGVAKALAVQLVPANADQATIAATAMALVPHELLAAAKVGRIAQHPAMIVTMTFVRAARDLRVPPEYMDYLHLNKPMHLRPQQEEMRQLNVARIPVGILNVFAGIDPPPPAGSDFAFALKCTLISHVLSSIAINALGLALKRTVAAREVLPVLWEEDGAIDALGIGH